jgi:hypothetical protein
MSYLEALRRKPNISAPRTILSSYGTLQSVEELLVFNCLVRSKIVGFNNAPF